MQILFEPPYIFTKAKLNNNNLKKNEKPVIQGVEESKPKTARERRRREEVRLKQSRNLEKGYQRQQMGCWWKSEEEGEAQSGQMGG